MRRSFVLIAVAAALAVVQFAAAQNLPVGTVLTPSGAPGVPQIPSVTAKGTVVAPPSTAGIPGRPKLPRTALRIYMPAGGNQPQIPNGETPASVACIYGVTAPTPGCPTSGTVVPAGGKGAIAVIEFGTYKALKSDVATFTSTFGLRKTNLTIICAEPPCYNNAGTGWDIETALDVEWAHAMAPKAHIYVIAFNSDPLTSTAEQIAAEYVAATGGGEVSNSWGYSGGEFSSETSDDSFFVYPSVVFFASAGDGEAFPQYPSVSPNVVSAGGTTIHRDGSGNFTGETGWQFGGGGISAYEPLPSYQGTIQPIVGNFRGTPDVSAIADPNSGVAVFNSTYCGGWCVIGGTSASSPILAGITNASGSFESSTNAELTKIYNEYTNATEYQNLFNDITVGYNGYYATKGWDVVTGVGTPKSPKGE
ncbi:MAG: S53 family peptidase [Terriglobales bacterium]